MLSRLASAYKKISAYDQKIPQSRSTDQQMAPSRRDMEK